MKAQIRLLVAGAFLLLLALAGCISAANSDSPEPKPDTFYRKYVRLSDSEIQSIRAGQPVVKVLESRTPEELFVFGSVYIRSTPENYLKLASDVDALRKLPSYLAVRKFSNPPQLSDLEGFTLEDDDVKELKECRPGRCEVQLPENYMEQFQKDVNWSAPDAADQANRLAQRMALDALIGYTKEGNAALGVYHDKNHPADVAEVFSSILSRSEALPQYMPDLHQYLLDYPKVKPASIQSQFYWEKVKFGLKPTLRIVQAIVYRGTRPNDPNYAVAIKQLYSSHYFKAALDLTICVRDPANPSNGFYLITLKGSQQDGLTGFKGSIVRRVAVSKMRSSLESALDIMKQKLETQTQQTSPPNPAR